MKRKTGMVAALCCFLIMVYLTGAAQENDESNSAAVAAAADGEICLEFEEEITEKENAINAVSPEEADDARTANAQEEKGAPSEAAVGDEAAEESAEEAVDAEMQSGEGAEETVSEQPYADLAIAQVDHYVNIRSEPNTDGRVVGKIYDGAVAQVLGTAGEQGEWFQIISGSAEGYVKGEFFLYGDAAAAVIEEYRTIYAKVEADKLNVREAPSTEASRIGQMANGGKAEVLEDCGEWLRVQYTSNKEGYVAAEYVTVTEEFPHAVTLEEEAAQRAVSQQSVASVMTNIVFPDTSYTTNEELRQSIVDYAMQYVGNRYINGGSSLAGGTDCSGFTCFIYGDYGYSISRIPQGQYTDAGRSIDYSEIQAGDIICYSDNGGRSCTHVALYIGGGQIVHSANSRKGVIVSSADYNPIIGIKNVID